MNTAYELIYGKIKKDYEYSGEFTKLRRFTNKFVRDTEPKYGQYSVTTLKREYYRALGDVKREMAMKELYEARIGKAHGYAIAVSLLAIVAFGVAIFK